MPEVYRIAPFVMKRLCIFIAFLLLTAPEIQAAGTPADSVSTAGSVPTAGSAPTGGSVPTADSAPTDGSVPSADSVHGRGGSPAGRFSLPPVDLPDKSLSTMEALHLKRILLSGNTVFSDEDLRPITGKYVNREVGAERLQALRLALTRFYVDQGYINSGVVIPDQKVENGTVRLSVIEGRLGDVVITGNRMLENGFILNRLNRGMLKGEKPLNMVALQRDLKLLKEDPHIDTLHARVVPGGKRGEAVLHLKVVEVPRHRVVFRVDNHGSPGTGSIGGELTLDYRSLFGRGDDLFAEYGKTEGSDTVRLEYTLPLGRPETSLSMGIDRSWTRVVSEPFSVLDITGRSGGEFLFLNHRFYRSLASDFSAGLKIERRFSRSYYAGRDFSYAEGAVNGESAVAVARFIQQWRYRTLGQAAAFYSTFSFGFDGLGATFSGREPDGRFFSWFGQFQWIKRISLLDSRLSLRLIAQVSDDPLFSMEKLVVGGASTVRGYREESLSGDQGLAASLEWEIPVGKIRIPRISTRAGDGIVSIVPFFDYGVVDNRRRGAGDSEEIYSAGMGIRWKVGKRLRAELFWGEALNPVERKGEYDIQDDGIHFKITSELL